MIKALSLTVTVLITLTVFSKIPAPALSYIPPWEDEIKEKQGRNDLILLREWTLDRGFYCLSIVNYFLDYILS